MVDAKNIENAPQKKKGARAGVQKFGEFLAGMVMPNIGAFIAWGLITALFIPTGWIPNATLNKLQAPMITYLLPLLIGYTGGHIVYGKRGAVVGAIATMGVIVGSSVTMFLGAMIIGPFSAFVVKQFDRLTEGKVKAGFEMLVNTFSAGIIGGAIAILGFLAIGPVVSALTIALGNGAMWITKAKILPLIATVVEPGKILFLNNAINHGIFDPVGISQVKQFGKSIFFLLESDPGPGLGVLLAYWIFGKGKVKSSAPGAVIIEFLGGIHEIYFPYVLMNPLLLLSVIFGGMSADFVFVITGAGLVASPSPGSIIAEIAMCPKGGILPVLAGILTGTVVSLLISIPIVKRASAKDADNAAFDDARKKMNVMKAEGKDTETMDTQAAVEPAAVGEIPSVIVFACDAGMGSSAMGETILRKKLQGAGIDITVHHAPVSEIPQDAQVVFTQVSLADRARQVVPHAEIRTVDNFLDSAPYDAYIASLKKAIAQQK
ncbi:MULTISPECIES: PTS mannitol transporter subunit IICB [Caproicibacterium]|jgi:PTS system mannitol-specific IIC component|uniref:PTS system mannitol-specific EIICB component n=1 Tax=Caproicibacterium lactatifermentans TaxID=2666138 RepID=A0A859DST8_9FIRM|nr:PTS mannitol transporter subunit IICB [Caproicibacterium lactatifermentans]ARP49479.1 PTS mannitol transporter subunit IIBC [Ruminococcaceae bacterium CPB6]MDD4806879.1 PTS mannitol transporter subunit IICB [Oscillospiraceae bacterium]QKN23071.1 PTS mannitol transporter subunit IICBA [Caproicibacterium lactatifermentans]QKO30323.1 PTS mannitol transporter subunit IICBA [Caproicibacterium lactatifermentans]